MRCRVKRNHGFRPITIKLRFDNVVEYECFRALMGSYAEVSTSVSSSLIGAICYHSGVTLSIKDARECLGGIMKRIWLKISAGKEGGK